MAAMTEAPKKGPVIQPEKPKDNGGAEGFIASLSCTMFQKEPLPDMESAGGLKMAAAMAGAAAVGAGAGAGAGAGGGGAGMGAG